MIFSEILFLDLRMTLSNSRPRPVPHSKPCEKLPDDIYPSGGVLPVAPINELHFLINCTRLIIFD